MRETIFKTTIRDYEHLHTKTRVSLVGTIHWGDPGYGETLLRPIEDRTSPDDLVHYEGIKRAGQSDVDAAGRFVTRKLAVFRNYLVDGEDAKGLPGTVETDAYAPKKENWQNHDLTDLEIARRVSLRSMLMHTRFPMKTDLLRRARLLDLLESRNMSTHWLITGGLLYGNMTNVLVDNRNTHALDALQAALASEPERGVTLRWGEGHRPGLHRGIVGLGFKQVDELKVPAIDLEALQQRLKSQDKPTA